MESRGKRGVTAPGPPTGTASAPVIDNTHLPKPILMRCDEEGSISVRISGFPLPVTRWQIGRKRIKESSKYRLLVDGSLHTLVISHVTSDVEQGVWVVATNQYGDDSCHIEVKTYSMLTGQRMMNGEREAEKMSNLQDGSNPGGSSRTRKKKRRGSSQDTRSVISLDTYKSEMTNRNRMRSVDDVMNSSMDQRSTYSESVETTTGRQGRHSRRDVIQPNDSFRGKRYSSTEAVHTELQSNSIPPLSMDENSFASASSIPGTPYEERRMPGLENSLEVPDGRTKKAKKTRRVRSASASQLNRSGEGEERPRRRKPKATDQPATGSAQDGSHVINAESLKPPRPPTKTTEGPEAKSEKAKKKKIKKRSESNSSILSANSLDEIRDDLGKQRSTPQGQMSEEENSARLNDTAPADVITADEETGKVEEEKKVAKKKKKKEEEKVANHVTKLDASKDGSDVWQLFGMKLDALCYFLLSARNLADSSKLVEFSDSQAKSDSQTKKAPHKSTAKETKDGGQEGPGPGDVQSNIDDQISNSETRLKERKERLSSSSLNEGRKEEAMENGTNEIMEEFSVDGNLIRMEINVKDDSEGQRSSKEKQKEKNHKKKQNGVPNKPQQHDEKVSTAATVATATTTTVPTIATTDKRATETTPATTADGERQQNITVVKITSSIAKTDVAKKFEKSDSEKSAGDDDDDDGGHDDNDNDDDHIAKTLNVQHNDKATEIQQEKNIKAKKVAPPPPPRQSSSLPPSSLPPPPPSLPPPPPPMLPPPPSLPTPSSLPVPPPPSLPSPPPPLPSRSPTSQQTSSPRPPVPHPLLPPRPSSSQPPPSTSLPPPLTVAQRPSSSSSSSSSRPFSIRTLKPARSEESLAMRKRPTSTGSEAEPEVTARRGGSLRVARSVERLASPDFGVDTQLIRRRSLSKEWQVVTVTTQEEVTLVEKGKHENSAHAPQVIGSDVTEVNDPGISHQEEKTGIKYIDSEGSSDDDEDFAWPSPPPLQDKEFSFVAPPGDASKEQTSSCSASEIIPRITQTSDQNISSQTPKQTYSDHVRIKTGIQSRIETLSLYGYKNRNPKTTTTAGNTSNQHSTEPEAKTAPVEPSDLNDLPPPIKMSSFPQTNYSFVSPTKLLLSPIGIEPETDATGSRIAVELDAAKTTSSDDDAFSNKETDVIGGRPRSQEICTQTDETDGAFGSDSKSRDVITRDVISPTVYAVERKENARFELVANSVREREPSNGRAEVKPDRENSYYVVDQNECISPVVIHEYGEHLTFHKKDLTAADMERSIRQTQQHREDILRRLESLWNLKTEPLQPLIPFKDPNSKRGAIKSRYRPPPYSYKTFIDLGSPTSGSALRRTVSSGEPFSFEVLTSSPPRERFRSVEITTDPSPVEVATSGRLFSDSSV